MRQTQGSMLCPSCGKLISVSEAKCPFCGAWRPGLYGWTPALQRLFGNRLDLISLIVATCIGLYVVGLLLEPSAAFAMRGLFNLLSPGNRALYMLGMTGGLAWDQGWWWTLLTAIYLHGGILHIFFNVLWIRQLGPVVTEVFGPARAFVIFSISGAAGFLLSNVASGNPSIGASGSIFGLLAALIVYGRRVGSSMLTAQLWQWAVLMFAFGFFMSGVNNWAHAGGFAGGWIVAEGMRFADKREGRGVQLLALVLLIATGAGFLISFVKVSALLRALGM
jgi:rhomboid protease GluP